MSGLRLELLRGAVALVLVLLAMGMQGAHANWSGMPPKPKPLQDNCPPPSAQRHSDCAYV